MSKPHIFSGFFRANADTDSTTLFRSGRHWIDFFDSLFVYLLAVCPILQNYQGLLVDARATVFVVFFPYVIARFWINNRANWLIILPLIAFSFYKIIDGGTGIVEIGREGLMCLYLLAAASGVIDTKKFFRCVISVSAIASVLIIIQYLCYYLCGFHLQLVPTSLFLDSSEQWIGMAKTGVISITGSILSFYRPSSFFLEPAHMALYCTPAVLLLLLTPGMNKVRAALAVLISIGVVASTSGMGIMLCLGLWFLFFAFYFCSDREATPISIGKLKIKGFTIKGFTIRPINILFIVSLLILVVLLYLFVDVFRSSINRILFRVDGYNAISGRTRSGAHAVSKLKGWDLILGKQNPGSEADWYMSAFYGTIYDYGLVGLVLSYLFYLYSVVKLKRQYFWMALMILGLSYFSVHTHGSSYLLFYCTMLLAGHLAGGTEDPGKLALRIHPLGLIKKG